MYIFVHAHDFRASNQTPRGPCATSNAKQQAQRNPEARHTCRPSHESRTRVRILWATMMWVMRCIYMRVPVARMTCSTTAAWSQPISACICVYLFMHYGCVYAYMYT